MTDAVFEEAARAHRAGNLAEAARLYGETLRKDAAHFEALFGLAATHFQRGQCGDAERLLARAAELRPASAEARHFRGRALARLGQGEEALSCFEAALAVNPLFADALCDRANLLLARGDAEGAVRDYDRALALKPDFAESWHNRGVALAQLRHYAPALASFDKALTLRPDSVQSRNNRAHALMQLKRYGEAAAEYERALEAQPLLSYARGYRLFCRMHLCDWRDWDEDKREMAADIRAGKRVIQPFAHMMIAKDPAEQLRVAELWVSDGYDVVPEPAAPAIHNHDRIRLAYLSADFRTHPVGVLIAAVLERHDRRRFETIAVSFGPDDASPLRARVAQSCDRFIDIRQNSDAEAAALLRAAEMDIAVDLTALTEDSRSRILAHRAAPVQVNWLGFPGTMGARYMDYIIADRIVIPDAEEGFYSEKIARLPEGFMPAGDARGIAPPSRTMAGLPEDSFVFCSFNRPYKFAPDMFSLWMRVLRAADNAVLWLAQPDAASIRNLRREAERHGVAAERIVFAPFLETREAHLARLSLADVFLDTLPCNAHSTAADALSAGVPVLTCGGTTFAGRIAASLLHAAGVPELIAESLADYEDGALRLTRDPDLLAALRGKLAVGRDSQPLFDTARFTRHLESAFATMYERARAGLPPASFTVEPQ